MKAKWVVLAGIFCLACAAGILIGQEKEDRTLLSQQQMTAIINEVSGERAMHHVLELVPYQFVRPPSEYQGHFRESEVMAKFAKEYGFSNVGDRRLSHWPDLSACRRRTVDDHAQEHENLRHSRHTGIACLDECKRGYQRRTRQCGTRHDSGFRRQRRQR